MLLNETTYKKLFPLFSNSLQRFLPLKLAVKFFEAWEARHFIKYAKHTNFLKHAEHAISWSTPSTQSTQNTRVSKHAI